MKEDTKQKYINKRYGDFIILSFVSNKRVLARCNCGKIVPIFLSSLTRKERTTTNCRECTIKRTINPNALSKNPTYKVYHGMVSRCKDIKNTASINYLLKGIKVSPIFLGVNGYSNFLKEVGERPNKNYSLDRIDPMKGYEVYVRGVGYHPFGRFPETSLKQLAATAALGEFAPRYQTAWRTGMRAKLGLAQDNSDDALVDELPALMTEHQVDYTSFFRGLARGDIPLGFMAWVQRWRCWPMCCWVRAARAAPRAWAGCLPRPGSSAPSGGCSFPCTPMAG